MTKVQKHCIIMCQPLFNPMDFVPTKENPVYKPYLLVDVENATQLADFITEKEAMTFISENKWQLGDQPQAKLIAQDNGQWQIEPLNKRFIFVNAVYLRGLDSREVAYKRLLELGYRIM